MYFIIDDQPKQKIPVEWPVCRHCGHPGPHRVRPVNHCHKFEMYCGAGEHHIKWLGNRGPWWLAQSMAAMPGHEEEE